MPPEVLGAAARRLPWIILDTRTDAIACCFILLYETGMRVGEALENMQRRGG